MPAVITGSAVLTCFGDGRSTFSALLSGATGVRKRRGADAGKLSLPPGHPIAARPDDERFLASRWLPSCLRNALRQSGIDPASRRVAVVVGTGLRELGAVEAGLPVAAGGR